MTSTSSATTRRLDGIAMALSGACLVHCLVLPIAAAALPMLAGAAQAEWVHWAFVAFAMPTSFFALRHCHQKPAIAWLLKAFAICGLLLLILGALGWPTPEFETMLSVAGGITLASVHLFNFFTKSHAT